MSEEPGMVDHASQPATEAVSATCILVSFVNKSIQQAESPSHKRNGCRDGLTRGERRGCVEDELADEVDRPFRDVHYIIL